MVEPVFVEARGRYRIYLRFRDGIAGEIDLGNVAGRGVFRLWSEPGAFEGVHISPHRSIAWGDEVEICADSLYLQLTGKKVEALLPGLAADRAHA